MADLPTGTVTFVFTDIEGSTRRWETDAGAMQAALQQHDTLLADVFAANNGTVFKHTGDGMCVAFASARDAVAADAGVQQTVEAADWAPFDEVRVRVGVHSGEAEIRDDDYFGTALSRVARIMDAGHGGQTLISGATAGLIRRGFDSVAGQADAIVDNYDPYAFVRLAQFHVDITCLTVFDRICDQFSRIAKQDYRQVGLEIAQLGISYHPAPDSMLLLYFRIKPRFNCRRQADLIQQRTA